MGFPHMVVLCPVLGLKLLASCLASQGLDCRCSPPHLASDLSSKSRLMCCVQGVIFHFGAPLERFSSCEVTHQRLAVILK